MATIKNYRARRLANKATVLAILAADPALGPSDLPAMLNEDPIPVFLSMMPGEPNEGYPEGGPEQDRRVEAR
jgi:hypothetical protein